MIIPDVNALVYAYRREAPDHDRYGDWLEQVVAGSDELGLVDSCLTGFLRIVTNPRILAEPAPAAHAFEFVRYIQGGRRARPLTSMPATWATFADFVARDRGVKANLMPDAYLAALAISHGGRLATADRGFGRFTGLDFFDPAA
ncbi:MAG TPA: TA system VapC family ribonuclease toxin [Jiangellaceae bacterium]|nr:TA system VapC family ribonuclease toxin [Jiangellaceae bacterium]